METAPSECFSSPLQAERAQLKWKKAGNCPSNDCTKKLWLVFFSDALTIGKMGSRWTGSVSGSATNFHLLLGSTAEASVFFEKCVREEQGDSSHQALEIISFIT